MRAFLAPLCKYLAGRPGRMRAVRKKRARNTNGRLADSPGAYRALLSLLLFVQTKRDKRRFGNAGGGGGE